MYLKTFHNFFKFSDIRAPLCNPKEVVDVLRNKTLSRQQIDKFKTLIEGKCFLRGATTLSIMTLQYEIQQEATA
jgi:hypothetical protein